jgi:raffinose/stachyose/melibiose transport system substrate-binding protein
MKVPRTAHGRVAAALALMATVAVAALASLAGAATQATTTLVVQDGEVPNNARLAAFRELDRLFEQAHPGVTIRRNSKSFADLIKTDALQLSGSNPPDVSHVNQGLPDMGQLVKAGLLTPLDRHATKWNWKARQSSALLAVDGRVTKAGKIGSGSLYGISTTADLVGVFANKAKLEELGLTVPKTFAQFERALAKAKDAGETPIMFGNLDKWPGIHEFQTILLALAPKGQVGATVFGAKGRKWSTPAAVRAATTLKSWVDKDYFTDGYGGLGYDDAMGRFYKGEGVFAITGTWKTGDVAKALGNDATLFLMPSAVPGRPAAAIASGGLAWTIPAKAKNKELAAEYINFVTSARAAKVVQSAGDVPAYVLQGKRPAGVRGDALAAWAQLNKTNSTVGYMDWASPTFYDTVTASIQELLAGKVTPQAFVKKLDADYLKYHSS